MTNSPTDGPNSAPEAHGTAAPETPQPPILVSLDALPPRGAHFTADREAPVSPSGDFISDTPPGDPSRDGSPPNSPPPDSPTDAQDTLIRKRKRKKRKRKGLRIAALVLVILLIAGGLAVWIALGMMRSGETAIRGGTNETPIESGENAVSYDEGKTVSYNGHTYKLNEDMVSLLFIGFDRAASAERGEPAGQADAVMVIAFDTQTGKMTAIGVPRDSMVDVSEFVGDAFIGQDTMQLCLSYSYGDGRERSCENTVRAVSRILYNIPITYYFALNESGIAYLNDAIGGVTLKPLQTVPGTNIVEGENIVLFGNNAYRYVQWRDTSVLNSSLDRQARQIQYVKTFASQALQLSEGSVGVLIDLFNTTVDYSVTNLGVNEFSYLASAALTNNVSNLDMITLDGEMVQGELYAEYYLDKNAVYETVLEVYYRQVD
jgi:anionic cell wall polymer biosynthesis LytR-Cps2A-Psr (LCP) family protein